MKEFMILKNFNATSKDMVGSIKLYPKDLKELLGKDFQIYPSYKKDKDGKITFLSFGLVMK